MYVVSIFPSPFPLFGGRAKRAGEGGKFSSKGKLRRKKEQLKHDKTKNESQLRCVFVGVFAKRKVDKMNLKPLVMLRHLKILIQLDIKQGLKIFFCFFCNSLTFTQYALLWQQSRLRGSLLLLAARVGCCPFAHLPRVYLPHRCLRGQPRF